MKGQCYTKRANHVSKTALGSYTSRSPKSGGPWSSSLDFQNRTLGISHFQGMFPKRALEPYLTRSWDAAGNLRPEAPSAASTRTSSKVVASSPSSRETATAALSITTSAGEGLVTTPQRTAPLSASSTRQESVSVDEYDSLRLKYETLVHDQEKLRERLEATQAREAVAEQRLLASFRPGSSRDGSGSDDDHAADRPRAAGGAVADAQRRQLILQKEARRTAATATTSPSRQQE